MTSQDPTTEKVPAPSGSLPAPVPRLAAGYGLGRRLRVMGAVLAGGLATVLALLLWLGVLVPAEQEAAGYASGDVAYAEVMVEHNAQAVQLTALVPGRSTDQAVLDAAVEVREASVGRVRELTAWLEARDVPVPTAGAEALALAENGLDTGLAGDGSGPRAGVHAHSHEGGNHGMLTDDQVDAVAALDGRAFDAALLDALVEHHEGGLRPAEEQVEGGRDAEAKALAQSEADAVRDELGKLRGVLTDQGAVRKMSNSSGWCPCTSTANTTASNSRCTATT